MIDENDLIYAAGFFDGEGCICIKNQTFTQKGIKNGQEKYYIKKYYRLEVSVVNTYFPVINWFKDIFGGYTSIGVRKNPIHKPIAKWGISSTQAVKFLVLIMPYLKQKKHEAEIALEFQRFKGKTYSGKLISKRNSFKQKELCELLRKTRGNIETIPPSGGQGGF